MKEVVEVGMHYLAVVVEEEHDMSTDAVVVVDENCEKEGEGEEAEFLKGHNVETMIQHPNDGKLHLVALDCNSEKMMKKELEEEDHLDHQSSNFGSTEFLLAVLVGVEVVHEGSD